MKFKSSKVKLLLTKRRRHTLGVMFFSVIFTWRTDSMSEEDESVKPSDIRDGGEMER
jgi:hypothetical protein